MIQDLIQNTAIVLIDFDNLFKKDLSEYQDSEIYVVFKNIVNELISENQLINNVNIRLYGGWYREDVLSPKASMLTSLLARINLFPYIQLSPLKRISGTIEIVTSLFAVNHVWKNTLREKKGASRIRVKSNIMTATCDENAEICPAKILNKFTKSKGKKCSVSGCNLTNQDIFISIEQKMIDTMLSCDFLTFCKEEFVKYILLISDDTDFFPPLALGSSYIVNSEKLVSLSIQNELLFESYKELFSPFNVNIKIKNYE